MKLGYFILILFIIIDLIETSSIRNHYATLGVKKEANEEEIKRAYRKLAMKVIHLTYLLSTHY